jgi:1,4-dihydroxy-2-naphthoate octaprenyltransferase
VYFEAARPRTLPAAFAPVIVGTAAAATPIVDLSWLNASLALLVALALQVAVNYANDYFDGIRGVDTPARLGPRRAVASGLVSPAQMRWAMLIALAVALVAGTVLAFRVGFELFAVGGLAVVAALGYSGGQRPYASRGLGEISVFIFFGLIATAGSAYVQDSAVTLLAALAAIPVGFFAVALIVVNNLRDIPTDREVGKRTLAVALGDRRTRALYSAMVLSAVLWPIPLALYLQSGWPLLGLLALPMVIPPVVKTQNGATGRALIGVLEHTGRAQLLFAVTLAVGLLRAKGVA